MPDLVKLIEPLLRDAGASLIAWYGHTGNLAVEGGQDARKRIAGNLEDVSERRWAVLSVENLRRALDSLGLWQEPEAEVGVRWTPGLALSVKERRDVTSLDPTSRAELGCIAPGIVGVFKKDFIDAKGRLDRERRQGGWGAISGDVASQLGGTWTARSARVLGGLERRSQAPTTARQ